MDNTRPFEWLTSPASLDGFVGQALRDVPPEESKVLHVGCGSSSWGGHVLERFQCSSILNIDKDKETLDQVREIWNKQYPKDNKMEFRQFDFLTDTLDDDEVGTFDLVLDKSTLDCTLCSDEVSAALLAEVHRALKPNGGVYLLVSFHDTGLLLPLLRDLPDADWEVINSIIVREVEDLISDASRKGGPTLNAQVPSETVDDGIAKFGGHPRTVNVISCRRQRASSVDRARVSKHVRDACDDWYRSQNPMLTEGRREQLFEAFDNGSKSLDLVTCYDFLFSPEERAQLDYELFLEDWKAYVSSEGLEESSQMNFELSVDFLSKMQ